MERRSEGNQVPESLDGVLNALQLQTLARMEGFGWMLAFIRRPLFQEFVTVLMQADNKNFGILEDDGVFNAQSDIKLR